MRADQLLGAVNVRAVQTKIAEILFVKHDVEVRWKCWMALGVEPDFHSTNFGLGHVAGLLLRLPERDPDAPHIRVPAIVRIVV